MSATDSVTKATTGRAKRATATSKGADGVLRLKQAQRAAMLLKHVSDPTRLRVILTLVDGEQHVGALCGLLAQSQPAVSHHLALLRHGGVISPRRDGKNNYYGLTDVGRQLAKVVVDLV